jgi:thiol-disulfide isomerase/thioredoxin
MKISKLMYLFAITLITLSSMACSQENKAADNNKNVAQTQTTSPESGVYTISSIINTGDKEPIDFTWVENGKEMKFSDFVKGKVTFINFWGTWCPPCRAEIPGLIALNKKYKDKGFQIVGIPLERDMNNQMTTVSNYVQAAGINYRNFPSRPYSEEFGKKFGQIQYVPTTFVIGPDGKVVDQLVGGKSEQDFENVITKYIKN